MDTQEYKMTHKLALSRGMIQQFGSLVGERLPEFSAPAGRNHHNDDEIAKAAGLPAPVGYSLQYYAPVSHLMAGTFRQRWFETGEMSVAFLKPVFAGDELTIAIGHRPVQRQHD